MKSEQPGPIDRSVVALMHAISAVAVPNLLAKFTIPLLRIINKSKNGNSILILLKFTVEQEVENAIPFLDVLIIRNNGQLATKAYRKPTHTIRYLNFNSCHNFSQKVGLVKTLLFRANSKLITNYRDRTNEVKFACNALRENEYPDWLLNKLKK